MAHIIYFSHPFKTDQYTQYDIATGADLATWIADNLPAASTLLATCNFTELDSIDGVVVGEHDVISLRPSMGFGIDWIVWAVLAVSVASSVYMYTQMPDPQSNHDTKQASSVYNYNAQGNKPKMGNPVPVQFGRMPDYPDIIAPNWWEYIDNEQYYYQTFSKGIGKFLFHRHMIGETPISQYGADISVKVHAPGTLINDFPHVVWTSKEVGGSDGQGGLKLEAETSDWVASVDQSEARFRSKTIELWDYLYRPPTGGSGGGGQGPGSGGGGSPGYHYWQRQSWPWKTGQHVVVVSSARDDVYFKGNLNFIDAGDSDDPLSPQPLADLIENQFGWAGLSVSHRITITGAGVNAGTYRVKSIDGNFMSVYNDDVDVVTTFEPMSNVFCTVTTATVNDGTFVCKDDDGTLMLVNADTLEEVEHWAGFNGMDSPTARLSVLEREEESKWVGNFLAVPSSAEALDVGVDILLPRGLGEMNNDGNIVNRSITWEVRARKFNTGSDYIYKEFSLTKADNTPQRLTYWLAQEMGLSVGLWEIGCRRKSAFVDSTRIFDEIQWMGLKSVIQRDYRNDEETIITLKIKATNALSTQANQQYWCDSTRILPVLQQDGSYKEQPSRSIADAVIDACRNAIYGAGLNDSAIDRDTLLAYRHKWAERGDYCDGLFDQPIQFWTALENILQVGRAFPRIDFGAVSLWRDEPRSTLCKPYSPVNMTPDSFAADISMVSEDDNDGIEVEWFNPNSRKSETLLCTLPHQNGYNPKKLTSKFITNEAQAKREGLFHAAVQAYRRTNINFTTDIDGWESNYGDCVPVAHDAVSWGASGQVIEKLHAGDGNQYLQLSGLLSWEPEKQHYIVFNDGNSGIHGPYRVVATKEPDIVVLLDKPTKAVYAVGENQKPSEYMFGPADRMYKKCILMGVKHKGEFEVSCSAIEDDPRVDAYA